MLKQVVITMQRHASAVCAVVMPVCYKSVLN